MVTYGGKMMGKWVYWEKDLEDGVDNKEEMGKA